MCTKFAVLIHGLTYFDTIEEGHSSVFDQK